MLSSTGLVRHTSLNRVGIVALLQSGPASVTQTRHAYLTNRFLMIGYGDDSFVMLIGCTHSPDDRSNCMKSRPEVFECAGLTRNTEDDDRCDHSCRRWGPTALSSTDVMLFQSTSATTIQDRQRTAAYRHSSPPQPTCGQRDQPGTFHLGQRSGTYSSKEISGYTRSWKSGISSFFFAFSYTDL